MHDMIGMHRRHAPCHAVGLIAQEHYLVLYKMARLIALFARFSSMTSVAEK